MSLHSLSLSPDWQLPSSAALSGSADSRDDQSDLRWSLGGDSRVSQQEVLEIWRRQFASVGTSSPCSFGEDFYATVSARFVTVRSACAEGSGLFDAPFTASEVRHALTLCGGFQQLYRYLSRIDEGAVADDEAGSTVLSR